ncbi:MAG: DUF4149 domain-containing protein [Candidatus Obscuribacterales bacterium]|nr:DUF4149 domain-containing protein [Candidatus Obscuribacterales bacterium]
MHTTSKLLRTVSLALLFGGSSAIVFAAIVLVKAAQAKGVPVPEAAATNAPIFIHFSKIALGSAVVLLLSEIMDLFRAEKTKLTVARYATSAVCIVSACVFALVIVPPLDALLPVINTDPTAHKSFHDMHELSRAVFGVTIFSALLSLILPIFEKPAPYSIPTQSAAGTKATAGR